MTNFDDAELMSRAKGGCATSVAILAARHQAAVVDYVARILAQRGGSRADADDVAQESLVQAICRLDRHDERWPFSTWLFAIARRRCLNHLRSARRRAVRDTGHALAIVSAERDAPWAVAAAREESERLWAVAARELPERHFTALWLRTVEDLPVAEIARVLRQPPATVKVHLFRARQRLAAALGAAAGPLARRAHHG